MYVYIHLWLEFATPAIYHATRFVLAALDRVQDFLEGMGVSAVEALLCFKLAPLGARRDVAMLGLLHRIVWGQAPPQFSPIIRNAGRPLFPRSHRDTERMHCRQLHDPFFGAEKRCLQRSWLRLIYTYNMLPQCVVDATAVCSFQRHLQAALSNAARAGTTKWTSFLSSGVHRMSIARFQQLFSRV